MDKIVIIGVNRSGEIISCCVDDTDEEKLIKRMSSKYDCEDFFALQPEDIENIEVAIEQYYDHEMKLEK